MVSDGALGPTLLRVGDRFTQVNDRVLKSDIAYYTRRLDSIMNYCRAITHGIQRYSVLCKRSLLIIGSVLAGLFAMCAETGVSGMKWVQQGPTISTVVVTAQSPLSQLPCTIMTWSELPRPSPKESPVWTS